MGGETPDRSALTPPGDAAEDPAEETAQQRYERRRRFAMVRLAVGGPTFMILIFGLVIAYRVAGRSMGDGVFWAVLGTLVVGFGLYAATALVALRRPRP